MRTPLRHHDNPAAAKLFKQIDADEQAMMEAEGAIFPKSNSEVRESTYAKASPYCFFGVSMSGCTDGGCQQFCEPHSNREERKWNLKEENEGKRERK